MTTLMRKAIYIIYIHIYTHAVPYIYTRSSLPQLPQTLEDKKCRKSYYEWLPQSALPGVMKGQSISNTITGFPACIGGFCSCMEEFATVQCMRPGAAEGLRFCHSLRMFRKRWWHQPKRCLNWSSWTCLSAASSATPISCPTLYAR